MDVFIVLAREAYAGSLQAARLAEARGLVHVSAATLVSGEVGRGSVLGRNIAAAVAVGDFTRAAITRELLRAQFRAAVTAGATGLVLDGAPSSLEQLRSVDELVQSTGAQIRYVLALEDPEGRGEDDARLEADGSRRSEVAAVYAARGLLRIVSTRGTREQITSRLHGALRGLEVAA